MHTLPSRLSTILSRRPLGLVFDIDGTLSPIASTPGEAHLYQGIAENLEQARQHAHIAIMTGRTVHDGAGIINIKDLTYIGSHGLEWSNGLPSANKSYLIPEAEVYVAPGKHILEQAEQLLSGSPGILIEHKQVGGAIHYRQASEPERTRKYILSVLAEPVRKAHMRLEEGKKVIEIRAPLAVNKGTALRRFTQNFHLQSIVFAGDDRTDLDAILAIEYLRQQGIAAYAIVVQHTDTLPDLLEHADHIVQEVEGMAEFLRCLVSQL